MVKLVAWERMFISMAHATRVHGWMTSKLEKAMRPDLMAPPIVVITTMERKMVKVN